MRNISDYHDIFLPIMYLNYTYTSLNKKKNHFYDNDLTLKATIDLSKSLFHKIFNLNF